MKKPIHLSLIVGLFCLFLSTRYSYAQQTVAPSLWQIETKDGNVYYGRIIDQSQEVMRLETDNLGVISIAVNNIRHIKEVSMKEVKDGKVWPINVQASRYFFVPNGYGLREGEAYYQNVWVFFNQASIGITDNFSMGLGVVPLFLFAGAPTPIWITPKVSIPIKENKLNLGGGALLGTVLGEDVGAFGLAYGVVTLGNRNTNLNLGLGYGFAGGEWGDTPLFHVGGMARLSKKGYLLSENYFIAVDGDAYGLISLGGRTTWNRFSLDYGGVIPVGETGALFIIPWLGFVVPLGN